MRCNGAFLRLNLKRLFSDPAFLVLLFAFGAAAILPLTVEYIDNLPRIGSQHLLDYCFFSLAGMGAALGIFAPIRMRRSKEEYEQLRFPVYLFNLLMISLAALFFLTFFIVYLLTALLFPSYTPQQSGGIPPLTFSNASPLRSAICSPGLRSSPCFPLCFTKDLSRSPSISAPLPPCLRQPFPFKEA